MTNAAFIYILGVLALLVGVFSVWRLYLAKRGKEVDQASRSMAVKLQRESSISTGSPVTEDEALRSEFGTVKKMPPHADRDALLEKMVQDAISVGDWWLAMEISDTMATNLGKDKALKVIVDAAIVKKEWCLGALAANKMFYKNFQEQAKQRLVDEAGKEGSNSET